MFRFLQVGTTVLVLLVRLLVARFSRASRRALPAYLRRMLERSGPAFIKVGQALSLRRDLLPDDITIALQGLQDHVAPFASAAVRPLIEAELRRNLEAVFASFEDAPFAAASIAQIHRARLRDGREVIVKVRRPGIRNQVDRDMRLLVAVLGMLGRLLPAIRNFGAVGLAREIWLRLQLETDLLQEAQNVRRFVEGFRDQPLAYVPDVIDDLCTPAVMVQEFSHGCRIDDERWRQDGPRIARTLIDLYLHQFFVMGIFHGDPHPGNLFVLPDGRLCFHDFGVVGHLTPAMRRCLATFVLALSNQDEDWLLGAATDLGVLSPGVDRGVARASLGAMLTEYAGRRLGDWSLGEVLVRVMRLGQGTGFALPANLAILARTAGLMEQTLRQLDRNLTVIDAMAHADAKLIRRLFTRRPERAGVLRLKAELATAAQQWPRLLAELLRGAQRSGGRIPLSLRVEALQSTGRSATRSADRLALALVALGLYIAASLLMQHSLGPRLWGDMPVFAAIGYALALWFTLRIVRGIGAAERSTRSVGSPS